MPCVHVMGLKGQSICHLPEARAFVPEDVAMIALGSRWSATSSVGLSTHFSTLPKPPQGHWVMVGAFPAPRGLAAEAAGHLLVKDSMPGAVHCVPLSPALQPRAAVSTLGLEGPHWVGRGPYRGRAVSKEIRMCGCWAVPASPGARWGSDRARLWQPWRRVH